jgi:selenoprotein W-related protein
VDFLLDLYEGSLSEITLKPSSGGRFEVSLNGQLIFSKLANDRFPEVEELDRLIGERIGT